MPTLDEVMAIPLFADLAPHELERVARVAAAVGEGSMAIAFVHQFLANDAGAA
jgi:phage tail sheath gpL-like